MSITKNRQSPEALRALCATAFPHREVRTITELTEGMFNAAYRVDFTDGASVLKIAAGNASGLLSNEVNLMGAEVAAMHILQEHNLPHVAQVQYADFTRSLCSGSYFVMECLPGRSLSSCREALSADEIAHVMTQVGAFQRQTAGIRGESFGLLGLRPGRHGAGHFPRCRRGDPPVPEGRLCGLLPDLDRVQAGLRQSAGRVLAGE